MALRRSATLAGVVGGAGLLASSLLGADRVVIQPPPSRPFHQLAQPCLINATSCLELSATPFAPCLIVAIRCGQEWSVVPLESFRSERPAHPPHAWRAAGTRVP